jgi:RNA polymerase sigma-70 factor (ECF subfamily)
VFQRYRRDVYGWAYRLLGRHHDALDAAQDVFVRWMAQARREAPKNPRGWLRQVTLNRAIDLLRSRRESSAPLESTSPRHGSAAPRPLRSDGAASPAECVDPLEREELRRDIAECLQLLTDAQRAVLVAKVYDGMTFAEIAAEQGVAVPTVKTHYLRAIAAVRDRLRRRWEPERNRA